MKNLLQAKTIICAVFAFAMIVLPFKIFAIGQTTDPIIIKNAIRGNEYQKIMTVINTEKKDVKITFSAEGQVGKWAKFYPSDNSAGQLAYVEMKQGEVRNINVVFTIPLDIPNGKYKGFVSVIMKQQGGPSVQEGSSTSVSQKIDREVAIEVGGKEIVSFDVSVIPKTYDLQKDEMLSIRLIYDNQGNVSISPQVQLRITPVLSGENIGENGSQAVYNTIYPYPENQSAVKAGAIYEIPAIEIPTNNFAKGKYAVDMNFTEKGKTITDKKFVFSSDVFKASDMDMGIMAGFLKSIGLNSGGVNMIILTMAVAAILGIAYLIYYKKLLFKKIDHEKS